MADALQKLKQNWVFFVAILSCTGMWYDAKFTISANAREITKLSEAAKAAEARQLASDIRQSQLESNQTKLTTIIDYSLPAMQKSFDELKLDMKDLKNDLKEHMKERNLK